LARQLLSIAIFGQGPVGLSATQLAARVIAVDIAAELRKLAQQFGAHEVLDPAGDVVAAIRDLTHGEGAHKTLDASSAPDARAAAVRAVRSWGTACFVGERGQVTLDVSPDLQRRQVTLVGSIVARQAVSPWQMCSTPSSPLPVVDFLSCRCGEHKIPRRGQDAANCRLARKTRHVRVRLAFC
jgi:threonine dehydrogenase-like Zn-dependent dehydrogenase